jgi:hypothetical protein
MGIVVNLGLIQRTVHVYLYALHPKYGSDNNWTQEGGIEKKVKIGGKDNSDDLSLGRNLDSDLVQPGKDHETSALVWMINSLTLIVLLDGYHQRSHSIVNLV